MTAVIGKTDPSSRLGEVEARETPPAGSREPSSGFASAASTRRQRLRAWIDAPPRPVAHVRLQRTTLRTLHLIAVAVLYGGHWHGVEAERLLPALLATLASGAALAALELWRAPVWLVQTRGLVTLLKVGLVIAVAFWWEGRLYLLTGAMVLGAGVAHAPGRIRYHSWLHGRVAGPEERG